jgi:uncharacterized protein YndB with AHSA1/START domain
VTPLDVTDDRRLTLTRLIDALPAHVWRCWTDPTLLPRWFGPDGHSCMTKEIDLRQGGLWRFDMIRADGVVYANRHRYTLFRPTSRIEFLLDGDDDRQPPMTVEVTLTPEGQGTRITQTITLASAEAKQHALGFGADRLGLQTLGKLAALAATL